MAGTQSVPTPSTTSTPKPTIVKAVVSPATSTAPPGALSGAPTSQIPTPVKKLPEPLFSPGLTTPKVPSTAKSGNGQTTVNTSALKQFADNIDQLTPQIRSTIDDLGNVTIAAGAFPKAVTLATTITGSGQLRDNLVSALTSMRDTLEDLSPAIRKIAADYTKSEDLNNIKVADYERYMTQVAGDISGLGSSGGSNGTTGSTGSGGTGTTGSGTGSGGTGSS